MISYNSLSEAVDRTGLTLLNLGYILEAEKWQSIKAPAKFFETLNVSFKVPNIPYNALTLKTELRPNLPWADLHFSERVSGIPYNPPPSHEIWPFNQAKNSEFTKDRKFSHTYPERFWPKLAGNAMGGMDNFGIRFRYGDLNDVVKLLQREPTTRQAYLPIWFPEDTGSVHGERVPCTLGYLFMLRHNELDITYYMRSCDYLRHFRDDIYLACRLLHWVIDEICKYDPNWQRVMPGTFTMHIANLHIFETDIKTLEYHLRRYRL